MHGVKVIGFVITFASLGLSIYDRQCNSLHVGSEDCTTPYTILGIECDLPHPLFFGGFMASKFVISPEPFIQKCKSLAKAKHLYVDVKNGAIRLAWSALSEDGAANKIEYINRAEAASLGMPYELLLDAVLEAGGAIDGIGHYPVTDEIIGRLKKANLRK
jgi:hypothetical protein